MTQGQDHRHERDRAVRRSGRVRLALVGGATAASVGVAGVLGLTALTTGSASSAATTSPARQQSGTEQPRQAGLVADLKTFATGQQVGNGSGASHATTKGS